MIALAQVLQAALSPHLQQHHHPSAIADAATAEISSGATSTLTQLVAETQNLSKLADHSPTGRVNDIIMDAIHRANFSAVPSEWQVPLLVLFALLGFLAVIGFSSVSKPQSFDVTALSRVKSDINNRDDDDNNSFDDSLDEASESNAPLVFTPPRKGRKKKDPEETGTIFTPAGQRRSARLNRSKRD